LSRKIIDEICINYWFYQAYFNLVLYLVLYKIISKVYLGLQKKVLVAFAFYPYDIFHFQQLYWIYPTVCLLSLCHRKARLGRTRNLVFKSRGHFSFSWHAIFVPLKYIHIIMLAWWSLISYFVFSQTYAPVRDVQKYLWPRLCTIDMEKTRWCNLCQNAFHHGNFCKTRNLIIRIVINYTVAW
jgi:hypothetical protein